MKQLFNIKFDVLGTVEQEIEIVKEGVTELELVEKLNSGEYMTTLEVAHPDIGQLERTVIYFDEEGNEVDVAVILSQTVMDNSVYSNFELVK